MEPHSLAFLAKAVHDELTSIKAPVPPARKAEANPTEEEMRQRHSLFGKSDSPYPLDIPHAAPDAVMKNSSGAVVAVVADGSTPSQLQNGIEGSTCLYVCDPDATVAFISKDGKTEAVVRNSAGAELGRSEIDPDVPLKVIGNNAGVTVDASGYNNPRKKLEVTLATPGEITVGEGTCGLDVRCENAAIVNLPATMKWKQGASTDNGKASVVTEDNQVTVAADFSSDTTRLAVRRTSPDGNAMARGVSVDGNSNDISKSINQAAEEVNKAMAENAVRNARPAGPAR